MWLRRVTYENLRRNNNRRNSRSDSRKVFALRPETALRIYTYAPDWHSLPVRQTLPPVRKTETEEETVRRLLLQILTRLRKILTIINYGEATLLPPRFCFSIRHRKDVFFYFVIASMTFRYFSLTRVTEESPNGTQLYSSVYCSGFLPSFQPPRNSKFHGLTERGSASGWKWCGPN